LLQLQKAGILSHLSVPYAELGQLVHESIGSHAPMIWQMLQDKGVIYICGGASVRVEALLTIIASVCCSYALVQAASFSSHHCLLT
jgi:hypothetical protein